MKGTSCVRRLRLGSFCARIVPPMCFARMLVHVCVVLCVSWSSGCRSHWNGCMNVAWGMLWGRSRRTKPCVFPCKVAAGDDERYLVCAAGAAGVVSCANCSSYVFCNEWLFLCAKFYAVLQSLVADRIGAAAACVILLSFAARLRESYWSGCRWKVPRLCGGCGWGRLKCGVWSVKCGVWSVKCGVQRVQCQVWSVKCEVELQMWHVEQDTTFAECTHAQAWLAHGACKFYRWERSHIYF